MTVAQFAAAPITLYAPLTSIAGIDSQQIVPPAPTLLGGMIYNPARPHDQGLSISEPLFINIIGGLASTSVPGTESLAPGERFLIPPGVPVVNVSAPSNGHHFSAFFASSYTPDPPLPVPGNPDYTGPTGKTVFPPTTVTGLINTIGGYLYQEYTDDDDLQGWVEGQTQAQQDYVDTFNALNLPIYTGPLVAGKLLDWVGQGVYGYPRPALSSGKYQQLGPLNTWGPNPWAPSAIPVPLNELKQLLQGDVVVTDDDTYRRCLTWHFYKGDGKYFGVRWLKRRVWRFLYGVNGTAPNAVPPYTGDSSIADTEQISVSIGATRNATIRLVMGHRTVTGGAMLNAFGPNGFGAPFDDAGEPYVPIPLDDLETTYETYQALPYMQIFKEALESGVLEMPYQFTFKVAIG
jgi:hypothetical protein